MGRIVFSLFLAVAASSLCCVHRASAQDMNEITQLMSAAQNSWFGQSYRWKVEQFTEITAEAMAGQIEAAKKELESLPKSDPNYARNSKNIQYRIDALNGAIGKQKAVVEITAKLVSPSKWRVEYRYLEPVVENTTVFLSGPNGGAFQFLNDQKILRYHDNAKSVLADILRGVPDFIVASHLASMENSQIIKSPDKQDLLSFISGVSHLKYNLVIDPKTFQVNALDELGGGDKMMRSIVSEGDGKSLSKQFDPNSGSIIQQQTWQLEDRSPLGAVSEDEFAIKVPRGFALQVPDGDHSFKVVPIEGFQDLIFKKD